MNSNIEREIKAAKDKAQYDARAKRLLGNKYILAYILQEAVAEFKEESIQTIIGCIENDIRISSVSVEPGETNGERNMEQITGNNTEDKVPDENHRKCRSAEEKTSGVPTPEQGSLLRVPDDFLPEDERI